MYAPSVHRPNCIRGEENIDACASDPQCAPYGHCCRSSPYFVPEQQRLGASPFTCMDRFAGTKCEAYTARIRSARHTYRNHHCLVSNGLFPPNSCDTDYRHKRSPVSFTILLDWKRLKGGVCAPSEIYDPLSRVCRKVFNWEFPNEICENRRNTELTCNELSYEIIHCQTIVILTNAYRNIYIVVQGGNELIIMQCKPPLPCIISTVADFYCVHFSYIFAISSCNLIYVLTYKETHTTDLSLRYVRIQYFTMSWWNDLLLNFIIQDLKQHILVCDF
jgi:hypothetical protein